MAEEPLDDPLDNDEMPELNFPVPQTYDTPSGSPPRKGTHLRRHKSEAAVYFEKLGIFKLNEQKDTEDAANNAKSINISAFSKDPKQFAFELQRMIESIGNQKELPPKSIIIALLNVLNYWIENHGIKSINSLEEYIYKYESMESENNKQQMILQHKIDEYKNDHDEYQKRRLSFSGHTNELSQQLNEYEQQLQTASFLKTQILNLEKELEDKSRENNKHLAQRTQQQKQINTLTTDKLQLQKLIDSQKSQLSKMNSMDNELKIKTNEIREIKKKYKLIENELLQIGIEKEELYSEKKDLQHKLHDYGKLKANLNELENNQIQYTKTINTLNQTNIKLNNKINELKNDLLNMKNINNNHMNLVNIEEDESKQINEKNQIEINNNHLTFIDFTNETKTYNTENTPKIMDVITPKFDDELKKDLEEFEISISNDVNGICIDDMNDEKKDMNVNMNGINNKENNGNGNGNGNNGVVFGYRNMYRSFIIVGVSCLCYVMYTQYYHGSSWYKAKQIRDKYRKWQNGVGMKKRVIKKQSLRH